MKNNKQYRDSMELFIIGIVGVTIVVLYAILLESI